MLTKTDNLNSNLCDFSGKSMGKWGAAKTVPHNQYEWVITATAISIMKELDLIILIMTPKTSTLPYLAFQYQNQNCPQASNCVAIVMFSIVFLVYALANIFGDADLAKSMAG